MQAVILAGGEGLRLRPLTTNLPKPMIPLVNRPFLEHMIGYLEANGVTEVILALGYLPEKIQDYFGDGAGFGIKLVYSVEERPLGTAGAVKNLAPLIRDTFLVFNGDVVTDMDLREQVRLHTDSHSSATLFLVPVEDPTRFGVVETNAYGKVTAFTEKPAFEDVRANTINGGCYVLEPEVLDLVPEGEFHMFETGLFPALLQRGDPVLGHAPRAYWIDVGTPASYLQVHRDLLQGLAGSSEGSEVSIGAGAKVDSTARITGPAVIGDGCVIGAQARIVGPAVVGNHCAIGAYATVRDAVLWDDVTVEGAARLDACIVGRGASLGQDVQVEGALIGDEARVGQGNSLGPQRVVDAGQVLQPREDVEL